MKLIFIISAFMTRTLPPGKWFRSSITIQGQFLLAFFLSASVSYAETSDVAVGGERRMLKTTFQHEIITSDIFPWLSGDRQGPVSDVKGKMATRLDELLKSSNKWVDVAIYGVDRQNWLLDTVQGLVERNLRVRFVVDQAKGDKGDWDPENFTYPDTALLPNYVPEENIKIDIGPSGNARSSTMHNKFVVFDEKKVWLGSVNMSRTEIGSEYNANTVLVVNSPEIADIYNREFKQMFDGERFSRKKVSSARPDYIYTDGTEISVFFSPQDNTKDMAIVPFIRNAKKSINVGMFFLTDETVAEELAKAAKERNVKVRVIVDALAARSSSSAPLIKWMRRRGVEILIETWGGKMHMKTATADGKHTLMGSMNWSVSGEVDNDENTIVIRNNTKVAKKIDAYFEKLWASIDVNVDVFKVYAEGKNSKNSCFDGLDNDYDGTVDSDDPGCK